MATLLRNGAARAVSKSLRSSTFGPQIRNRNASSRLYITSISRLSASRLAISLYKPAPTALLRYASTATPGDNIDHKREERIGEKVMRAHPERVSAESTTHPVTHEIVEEGEEEDIDMMAGVKSDLVRIRPPYRPRRINS